MTDLHVPEGATWADLSPRLRRILLEQPGEAVVVATSGSSGVPKRVRLSGAALRASGEATATFLGGDGRWLLALPSHHVAGLQVLARSVLAGTHPVALFPGMPFTAATFAAAVDELTGDGQGPHYVSLVPTQLHRLLMDEAGVRAAASLDAILLGGAAADRGLLARARDAGARVVTTYGMSETCGGCVYDGRPLAGLQVRLEEGRVHLSGPMLADGYVDPQGDLDGQLTTERFVEVDGARWFRTDDRGEMDVDGRLRILGRVDDVIITGGHKVEPREVEVALRALPLVDDAVVVGLPDPEWGQVVAAFIVSGAPSGDLIERPDAWREALRRSLPPHALPDHALPRRVVVRDAIPLLPSGKPDLPRVRGLLSAPDR
ncbi:AMP-binding protein [Ornithinimicrobium pratense]|uniref:AMP-binding protein n=1 Tax=Ornithinimicrobium pratense TaxID=2593973 RepID=A0A5J6V3C5_9MICO|nr:AMP-binding protein [Ornithinimicrobium pratense]QFG67661.1 AMP-binding protein [Ornithinimicrobium pratense]